MSAAALKRTIYPSILGSLSINGGNALSTIEIDNQGSTDTLAVTSSTITDTTDLDMGLISYATARLLTINTGGDVDVQLTSNALITQVNAASGATITVGNSINGAQDIKGLLNIDSLEPGGLVNLTVNNSADPSPRTVTLGDSSLAGLAGAAIGFNPLALGNLILIGGGPLPGAADTSGNTFNLQTIPASATVTVEAGPGDDTINVGSAANELDTIAGNLNIDGQGRFNTLTINDQNTVTSQVYTVTDDEISRVGGPDIYYSDLSRVALNAGGAGSNTVNIESTLSGVLTTVNAGTGSTGSGVNAVYIGSEGSPSDLDGLAGNLTISGGNALSTIEIDGQGDTDGLTLTNATLAGNDFDGLITYSTARLLTINTGGNVAVQSTSAAVITDINSAGGTTISIGNDINGAQDVKGLLNLNSLSGLINVTVDNSADPSARTVTYNGTALSGLAGARRLR